MKNCVKLSIHRLWSQRIECKFKGKYNYKCNSDYCALNKEACDELKKQKNSIFKDFKLLINLNIVKFNII